MASAVVPWDQRPEFLEYTNWIPIPGVTSYAVPRKGSGTDVTQFHPGQAFLSEYNLPDIMYQLQPCQEWKRFRDLPLPEPKRNPDGSPVYEQYTRPGQQRQKLLDFKILPDKISTEEGWWYHEFVRRMDPRVRQLDIIMREEANTERLRMSDERYINKHLNTPGYRTYRPAWKMLSFHEKWGDERPNQRRKFVLDSLTNAQKRANTTRGSTPGLINPALGEIPGNRVPLPAVESKKQGPKHAAGNANSNPATLSIQTSRVRKTQRISRPTQTRQANRSSQIPQRTKSQQSSRNLRVSSSSAGAAPSSIVSAVTDGVSQNIRGSAAIARHDDTQGYVKVQARDAAAMPPPPRRAVKPRNSQSYQSRVHSSLPELSHSTKRRPQYDATQTNREDVDDFRGTILHVPEPGYPILTDEEMATMSAKSDKAMAEMYWICEPFLDSSSSHQDQPPMDLSAELIDYLGGGFSFPNQSGDRVREEGTRPMLSQKKGTKRKERYESNKDDEDYGNCQQVQLDVERQASRPVKRVKSVHHSSSPINSGAIHHSTANSFKQQVPFNPQLGNDQFGYSQGQKFLGPVPQEAQPPQYASVKDLDPYTGGRLLEEDNGSMKRQYEGHASELYWPQHDPWTSSWKMFPDIQRPHEIVASPYLATSGVGEGIHDYLSLLQDPEASADTFSHGDCQVGEALEHPSFGTSSTPSTIYVGAVSQQCEIVQARSRADREYYKEFPEWTSSSHQHHPYTNPEMGIAKSREERQMQQLGGEHPVQPNEEAQVDDLYISDAAPALLDDASLVDPFPDVPLDPLFRDFIF